MNYDAILEKCVFVGNIAFGVIKEDSKGRFADGKQVKVSTIKTVDIIDGVRYITTRNTVYKLDETF